MDHYDYYNNLSPERFQDLAIDIIEKREEITFEVFAKERDQGIDARGTKANKIVIMQAKRNNEYYNLRKTLKKEAEKIKKINPDRYILITTIKMTPGRKEEIKQYFKSYIQDDIDIIGKEDIDNFISNNKNIEILEKYNELWLSNTHVLEKIIERTSNRGINEESKYQLTQILKKEKIYSENQYFYNALETLKQKHYILIYGSAGAGKTTLAGHLCYYFLKKMQNAEFIYTDTMDSLKKVYKANKNQIIFLDDFWGSWRKNKNGGEIDTKQLIRMIQMIEEDESKILVITSREYIFRQFEEENYIEKTVFRNSSILMNIEDYTPLQKAKILFKQLENTKICWNDIYEITENYSDIIEHPNYNPRILEMCLQKIENEREYISAYEKLYMAIEEPEEFLKGIFYGQKEGAKIITFLLLLFSGKMKLETLEIMFCDYIDEEGKTINAKKNSFKEYIKQLENTITEEYRDEENTVIIIFKNSTIEETIQEQFIDNLYAYSKNIIKITKYLNPLLCLCDIWDDKNYDIYRKEMKLSIELKEQIVEKIVEKYEKLKWHEVEILHEDSVDNLPRKNIENLIKIIKMSSKLNSQKLNHFIINKVDDILQTLKNSNLAYYEKGYFPELLKELIKNKIEVEIEPKEMIESFYKKINFASEYITLNEIGKIYPREYKKFMEKYENTIKEGLKEQVEKDNKYFEEHECYMEQQYLQDVTEEELEEIFKSNVKKEKQKKIKQNHLIQNKKEDGNIKEEIKNLLGLNFLDITDKEKIKYIKSLDITKEEKEMLIESSKEWYISPFFRSKESIDGIIDFLLNQDPVPIKDFIAVLLSYRLEKSGLKPYTIGKVSNIAFDTLFTGDLLFRKEEIFDYNIDQKELDILIQNKILYKRGNWIGFENLEVLAYLCLIVVTLKQEELPEAICALIALCDRSGYYISNTILQLCEEINQEEFEEELIKPSISCLKNTIDNTNEIKIAKSIIGRLYITLHKYKNTQYITTIGLDADVPMLGLYEVILVYKVRDVLEKISKIDIIEFKKYNKRNRVNMYEYLEDKEFIKILKQTGIIEIMNEIYKRMEQIIST